MHHMSLWFGFFVAEPWHEHRATAFRRRDEPFFVLLDETLASLLRSICQQDRTVLPVAGAAIQEEVSGVLLEPR